VEEAEEAEESEETEEFDEGSMYTWNHLFCFLIGKNLTSIHKMIRR